MPRESGEELEAVGEALLESSFRGREKLQVQEFSGVGGLGGTCSVERRAEVLGLVRGRTTDGVFGGACVTAADIITVIIIVVVVVKCRAHTGALPCAGAQRVVKRHPGVVYGSALRASGWRLAPCYSVAEGPLSVRRRLGPRGVGVRRLGMVRHLGARRRAAVVLADAMAEGGDFGPKLCQLG
jgi:hypothetical protein